MEELYKSLISSSETLMGQLENYLFEVTEPDGPVLILVNPRRQFAANNPHRAAFLNGNPDFLSDFCNRIDDGFEPCVTRVEGGCLIGSQLATETTDCGYILVFMPGYQLDTLRANMDLFELILAQAQLLCQLLDKNNQLHHAQLSELKNRSAVLCS